MQFTAAVLHFSKISYYSEYFWYDFYQFRHFYKNRILKVLDIELININDIFQICF